MERLLVQSKEGMQFEDDVEVVSHFKPFYAIRGIRAAEGFVSLFCFHKSGSGAKPSAVATSTRYAPVRVLPLRLL